MDKKVIACLKFLQTFKSYFKLERARESSRVVQYIHVLNVHQRHFMKFVFILISPYFPKLSTPCLAVLKF